MSKRRDTADEWTARLPFTLLETWRADADRWQRLHGCSASKVATPTDGSNPVVETVVDVLSQRLATLIDALNDARSANVELGRLTIDDAPHGPLCTSLDAGCPDCLRLQRAAARKTAH